MADPAAQLARIYQAGFEITQLERYPGVAAVVRDEVIALLRPTPAGLEMVGTPGWKIGESIGVLIEKNGGRYFQSKSQLVELTPERSKLLEAFRRDLGELLLPAS
jgi:hypothetical protein